MEDYKKLTKYLEHLGVDAESICINDLKRLEETIKDRGTILSQHKDPGSGPIRPIPLDGVTLERLKKETIKWIGYEVAFRHSDTRGRLLGIADDDSDLYYIVLDENNTIQYITCVDSINYIRP